MIKFEVVKEYENKGINLPKRGTKLSAGYDFESATDIVIPSLFESLKNIKAYKNTRHEHLLKEVLYFEGKIDKLSCSIDEIKKIVEDNNLRVQVPTGIKACMESDMVLKIYPRSSIGSNCLLFLPNNTGIIDADYYNNPKNEGHILIPFINLSPYCIKIKKGERIAQGIFSRYEIVDDDNVIKERLGGFGSTN